MTLSTTVDATYGDDPANPSQKQHQQDHDVIHAAVNEVHLAPAPSGDTSGATDTTALQTWLNTSTNTTPIRLQLRRGTYYINTALVFPFAPGTKLVGAGRDVTIIRQVTAGQAIIRFTTTDTHTITWSDFTLEYSSAQTNTSSIAVTYEGGGASNVSYYSHAYDRIRVRNAYTCWAIVDAVHNTSVWTVAWNDCDAFSTKHTVFSFAPTVAIGMPNHVVNNMRIDNTSGGVVSDGPAFLYQGVEAEIGGLDLEGWYNRIFDISSGSRVTFRRVHIEHYTMNTALEMAMISDQGHFLFDQISITGTGTGQLGGTVLFHGGASNAVITVERLVTNMTISAGAYDVFYGSTIAAYELVGDVIVAGGTTPAAGGSTDAGTLAITRTTLGKPAAPALATNPPVSGTAYQNQTGYRLVLGIPVTGGAGAGTVQLALGSTSTPGNWGPAVTVAASAAVLLTLTVPSGWYYKVTAGGGTVPTIGTVTVLGE